MKAIHIKPKKSEPSDLWKRVTYPCLIEMGGMLAIAFADNEGYIISDEDEEPDCELHETTDTWQDDGWLPVVGSRTIEFFN